MLLLQIMDFLYHVFFKGSTWMDWSSVLFSFGLMTSPDWVVMVPMVIVYGIQAAVLWSGVTLVFVYPTGEHSPTAWASGPYPSPPSTPTLQSSGVRQPISDRVVEIVTEKHRRFLADMVFNVIPNMLKAIEHGGSAALQVLIASTSSAKFMASFGARYGGQHLSGLLTGVTSSSEQLRRVIRAQKHHVVTTEMQEEAVAAFVTEAKRFRDVLEVIMTTGTWPSENTDTDAETSLCKTMPPSSSAGTLSTVSSDNDSTRTGIDNEAKSTFVPPFSKRDPLRRSRKAAATPGVQYVTRHRATARVNPRASSLVGSGAICR